VNFNSACTWRKKTLKSFYISKRITLQNSMVAISSQFFHAILIGNWSMWAK
jgi:hypothetical protein